MTAAPDVKLLSALCLHPLPILLLSEQARQHSWVLPGCLILPVSLPKRLQDPVRPSPTYSIVWPWLELMFLERPGGLSTLYDGRSFGRGLSNEKRKPVELGFFL